MTAPVWLSDEVWLQNLLNWFVNRLETPRNRAITRRVTARNIPELFNYDGDSDYRWKLIEDLADEHQVFTIIRDRHLSQSAVHYENAQLRLNLTAEDLLREWLQRPRVTVEELQWRDALVPMRGYFQDEGESLLVSQPAVAGRQPSEIATAFAHIRDYLNLDLTLREISATCFWGDSKFLDGRKELLNKLFGNLDNAIRPRPLLLTTWAPAHFTTLLIIENQDTFLRLVDHPPPNYALIYSGGFKAGAARLTSADTRFTFLPDSDPVYFYSVWMKLNFSVYFWGDLDFAGMGILNSLKQSLPNIEPWLPGYQPMLQILTENKGHTAKQANKTNQVDPGITGSDYADEVLLPQLRRFKSCVDQEAVTPSLQTI